MTIDQAVTFLRNVMRNGTDTSKYTAVVVEQAIMGIGNDFIQRTHATRSTGTVALVSGTYAYSHAISNFRPEYILRAWLSDLTTATTDGEPPHLDITEYAQVYNLAINRGGSGQPVMIGFVDLSSFAVYPIPDATHTLSLLWDQPFTSWTAGSGGATVLNLPDEYMQGILRWGATYFVQGQEPEYAKVGAVNWQNYLDFVARIKSNGAASQGKQADYRNPRRGIPGSNGPRRIITDTFYTR